MKKNKYKDMKADSMLKQESQQPLPHPKPYEIQCCSSPSRQLVCFDICGERCHSLAVNVSVVSPAGRTDDYFHRHFSDL